MLSLIWLMACDPTASGPGALVGQLTESDGTPLVGVEVTSLETRSVTDADGRFAVEFKPPDQHATIHLGLARYTRVLLPEDDGQLVQLTLPANRQTSLRCEATCQGELRWTALGAGLTARHPVNCSGQVESVPLTSVPRTTPDELRCDEGTRLLEERGGVWTVASERTQLRIEVTGDPQACTVTADDIVAQPTGEGTYTASTRGRVTVQAVCDGRAALPQVVEVADTPQVTLQWSAEGAELDGQVIGPELTRLSLVAEPQEGRGWLLTATADADGIFHLPVLPPGRYRLTTGPDGVDLPLPLTAPEPSRPAVLAHQPQGQAHVGAFFLEADHRGRIVTD